VDALESLEGAGSSTRLARERARARLGEAEGSVGVAAAAAALAQAEVARLEALVALAVEGEENPRELEGKVAVDERAEALAEAARDLAAVEVRVAERNASLLVVKAPMDGIVMRLESAPGGVAGPEGSLMPGSEAATGSTGRLGAMSGALVSLYDPQRLQARVDVQLDQVGGIGAGTGVELAAAAVPGRTFHGEVIRLQREADILKNTLQVKVRITDPDPLLRPEMLVQARFLVAAQPGTGTRPPARVLVPSAAVRGDSVFVYDPTGGGKATRVVVKVVGPARGAEGFTEVEGPLGVGHKVILDPVEDGEAVRGDA
jgi:hypothetical protein